MTKRFLAIALSLLLLFTGVFLTACNKDDKDGESDASASAPLSAKDKFVSAAESIATANSQFLPASPINELFAPGESNAMSLTGALMINELAVEGTPVLGDGVASVALDCTVTKDLATAIKGSLMLVGEELNVEATYKDGDLVLFFEDLMDSPVLMDPKEEDEEDEEAIGSANSFDDVLTQLEPLKKLPDIIERYCGLLSDGIGDSMFTEAQKDVTVGDKEYKNAQVLTFSLSKEQYKVIAGGIVAAMKEDSELLDIINIFYDDGEFDPNELDEITEDTLSAKIDICVVDGFVVSATATVTDEPDEGDEDDEAETAAIEYTAEKGDADTKYSLKVKEEDELLMDYVSTVKNDLSSMSYVSAYYDDGEKTRESTTNVTKDGDSYEYEVYYTVYADGEKLNAFAIEYSVAYGENQITAEITKITVNANGMDVSIPLELSVSLSMNKDKIAVSLDAAVDIPDTITLDVTADLELAVSDKTVTLPENYISESEFDSEAFGQKFVSKYPNLSALIAGGISGPGGNTEGPNGGDNDVSWVDYYNENGDTLFTFDSDGFGCIQAMYGVLDNKDGKATLQTFTGKSFDVDYEAVDDLSFVFNGTTYCYDIDDGENGTPVYYAYSEDEGPLYVDFYEEDGFGLITVTFQYEFDFENNKLNIYTIHGSFALDFQYIDDSTIKVNGTTYTLYEG